MNGVHDMGGMHGFGPVEPEPNEPVFHHEWEGRVFALVLACGAHGRWNIDLSRFAREQMPPADYLATGYYEHWLFGLERLIEEKKLLQATPEMILRAADVQTVLRKSRGARVDADVAPSFKVGDRVRARDLNPVGHTRLPRYCRGRRGVIHSDQGVWIFPDTHAAGQGQKPQHVYSVRFPARELWGPGAAATDFVHVDLWDDYLERA